MAFVATIEDGQPKLRGVLDTGVGVENFLERIRTDYVYRSRLNALLRQRRAGSRADVPLGVPKPRPVLQRPGGVLPQMGTEAVAQGAGQIYQTITGETESGMFDDIFGGIGDVAGNIIEGINTVVEGVGSVVTDVAAAAGQIGQLGGAFEQAIQSIQTTAAGIPALIRGAPPVIYRGPGQYGGPSTAEAVGIGAAAGELLEEGIEFVQGLFGEEQPAMEGQLIPASSAMAACDLQPENYYYGWSSAANGYVLKKKRRRRRKMLATPSDLKQLAALKGVLGQGKAFETWIATRSV